jgi:hypothetical protein
LIPARRPALLQLMVLLRFTLNLTGQGGPLQSRVEGTRVRNWISSDGGYLGRKGS